MPADSKIIEIDRLVRQFGDRVVLNEISFNVQRGETLVIMGGSGCGKSTLLRHMVGSMKPTSGNVKLFGEEISGMKEREIIRIRLRFGMLFQSGALLASMTVGENVALPLLQHTDKSDDEILEIVEEKLQMVGLTGFEDLKPDEISGGMKIPANGEPMIEVDLLVRRFGDRAVLNDISFNVHRGETLVIMGGSGCGKSTLLRHMIGSMKPTSER